MFKNIKNIFKRKKPETLFELTLQEVKNTTSIQDFVALFISVVDSNVAYFYKTFGNNDIQKIYVMYAHMFSYLSKEIQFNEKELYHFQQLRDVVLKRANDIDIIFDEYQECVKSFEMSMENSENDNYLFAVGDSYVRYLYPNDNSYNHMAEILYLIENFSEIGIFAKYQTKFY